MLRLKSIGTRLLILYVRMTKVYYFKNIYIVNFI